MTMDEGPPPAPRASPHDSLITESDKGEDSPNAGTPTPTNAPFRYPILRPADHPAVNPRDGDGSFYASAVASSVSGGQCDNSTLTHSRDLSAEAETFTPSSQPPSIFVLHQNSITDVTVLTVAASSDAASAPKPDKGKGKERVIEETIGTPANYLHPNSTSNFALDGVTLRGHYLKICQHNLFGPQVHDTLRTLNERHDWESKVFHQHRPVPNCYDSNPPLYLCFNDLRDAHDAFGQVEAIDPTLQVSWISHREYTAPKDNDNGTEELPSYYDGLVIFDCRYTVPGGDPAAHMEALEREVIEIARGYGTVLSVNKLGGEHGQLQFRVEYFKISVAKSVLGKLTADKPISVLQCFFVVAKELLPWRSQMLFPSSNTLYVQDSGHGAVTPPTMDENGEELHFQSPTGRTAWRSGRDGRQVPLMPPRQVPRCTTNAAGHFVPHRHSDPIYHNQSYPAPWWVADQPPRNSSYPNYPSAAGYRSALASTPQTPPHGAGGSHHVRRNFIGPGPNYIYLDKVRRGLDVRTSIMLRNLPNDLDIRAMKQRLDELCFGRYDFSYLRIDFNNNKNVGYGFVNFLDATDIITLHEAQYAKAWVTHGRNGRRYGSRITDITYAAVQGCECLLEKLRNSSVMDENSDFRPKWWWSFETAPHPDLVGTDRGFPDVNNTSKKQRSRDNATQVGLFTSGRSNRRSNVGNGSHQSQFDRGTPAQIQAEAFYNQQMMPMQNAFGMVNLNSMPNAMYPDGAGMHQVATHPQLFNNLIGQLPPNRQFAHPSFFNHPNNGGHVQYGNPNPMFHQGNDLYGPAGQFGQFAYNTVNNGNFHLPGPSGYNQSNVDYRHAAPSYGNQGHPPAHPNTYIIPAMRPRNANEFGRVEQNGGRAAARFSQQDYQHHAGAGGSAGVPRAMPETVQVIQTENGPVNANGQYVDANGVPSQSADDTEQHATDDTPQQ